MIKLLSIWFLYAIYTLVVVYLLLSLVLFVDGEDATSLLPNFYKLVNVKNNGLCFRIKYHVVLLLDDMHFRYYFLIFIHFFSSCMCTHMLYTCILPTTCTSTTYIYHVHVHVLSECFIFNYITNVLTLTQKFTNPQIYPDVLISDQKMDVDLDFDPNTHAPAFCKLVECVLEVLVLNLCS